MRKFVIAIAAAGSALAFASPAAAQYYPAPQPYGQAYGYNGYNNYGQVQQLQMRIDALQNRIRWMSRTNGYGGRSSDGLRQESRNIERRLHQAARGGLNPYELNNIQVRIARLEQRLQYAGNRYGRGGYGYNGYNNNGYNNGGYYGGRDRDGDDDDRWDSNDQGHHHDRDDDDD